MHVRSGNRVSDFMSPCSETIVCDVTKTLTSGINICTDCKAKYKCSDDYFVVKLKKI